MIELQIKRTKILQPYTVYTRRTQPHPWTYPSCVTVLMLSTKSTELSVCGFHFSTSGFWPGEYGCKERESKRMKYKKSTFYTYETSVRIDIFLLCEKWLSSSQVCRDALRQRNLKRSLISTVRPTVHTNPSRKRSFSETLFKPEEFENAGFAF